MSAPLTRTRQITRKEVRGLFARSFITKSRQTVWPLFCEPIETFSKQEFFAALGTVPQLQATDDDMEANIQDFREYTYNFTNQLFSTAIGIKRSLVWFDQIKQTGTLLKSLAARVANFPDLRFITQLRNGTANLCLSGSNFFATTHALGGSAPATQSNLLTGHTQTSDFDGVALLRPALAERIQTDFDLALTQLVSWQDDNGQPFFQMIDPKDLVVLTGPKTFTAVKLALGARYINNTENVFQGVVGKIVCSNYLPVTGNEAADWYLAYTGGDNKPMVYSRYRMRQDSEFQDKLEGEALEDARRLSTVEILSTFDNPNDSYVIRNNENLVRANFLGEVTYGPPWYMVKIDNT